MLQLSSILYFFTFVFLPSQTTVCGALSAADPGINFSHGDPSVMSLLDGDQEKATANQAYAEEELFLKSSASRDELVMANESERSTAIKWIKKCLKVEARSGMDKGSSTGFGGVKPKLNKKKAKKKATTSDGDGPYIFNPAQDPHGFGAILQKHGVARINNVLSPETADLLTQFVDDEKLLCEEQITDGHVPEISRFSKVLLKKSRWDLLLQFEESDVIMQALNELLGDGKKTKDYPVMNVIHSTLGPDAELYELACLISDQGSDRQVIHPDIAFQGENQIRTGPLVTCFIALQDIDSQMGPTEFLPQSNTNHFHDQLNGQGTKNEMLSNVCSKLSLLKQGDCSIFDATTLHAGTANRSKDRRRLFYFTFRSLSMADPRTWNNPGSIRPELKERHLSLKDVHKEISSWKKGRKTDAGLSSEDISIIH